jgi:hypothetical protein
MPRYRFYMDGEDVGVFTTAAWDWEPGDEFVTGDRNPFKIVDTVDGEQLGDESEFAGVWTVSVVELAVP